MENSTMSIVKILAPVTGSDRDEVTLATAFQAAKPFASHVDVVFVHRDPREVLPYTEMPMLPDVMQSLIDSELEIQQTAASAARRSFDRSASECGIAVVDVPLRQSKPTASFREATGHLPGVLANAAILSDLVVVPPLTKEGGGETHDALVRILTKVGRPVLVCASGKPERLGGRIAIGWDGRDAAAKALVSAIPFLEKAASIELVSVGRLRPEDSSMSDAREFLSLHGIGSAERVIQAGSHAVADALLDTARDSGCDLLVVGGYGHSRLIESIFGGVTESIVSHPQVPLLMVH
jgi:nucleotide-binding universal stress UspA family protein